MKRILVVDDAKLMLEFMEETLIRLGYEVSTAKNGDEAFKIIKNQEIDMVFTDLKMPKKNGIQLLEDIKKFSPSTPVILMTAYGTVETAVNAMKNNATDYITKPFNATKIEEIIDQTFKHVEILKNKEKIKRIENSFCGIIGKSAKMQKIYEIIETVAPTNATIIISGETGVGKELVARAIYEKSTRFSSPFIKINCAAVPGSLLENELFGHEKGAYTDAVDRSEGKYRAAHTGTLLLDEIGDMEMNLQAKLLRVIQEGEVQPLGSIKTYNVDVRIITTTNVNIREKIKEKKFREDLFFRLNVVPISVPPLRERKEDIKLLVDYFTKKYCKTEKKLSDSAFQTILNYSWPGNVRELENIIHRSVVLSKDSDIFPKHLGLNDSDFNYNEQKIETPQPFNVKSGITIKELEKELIIKTLKEENWNRTKTAEKLGISVRTIRNKLNEYRQEGIKFPFDN